MSHAYLFPATATVTSGAAALLSARLHRARGETDSLPGCGGENSGCDSVVQTRWAFCGPLPVTAIGAIVNGAVCACLILVLLHPAAVAAWRALPWRFLLASIPVFAVAGSWFIALQAIAVHRFCPYCTAIHVLGFITAFAIAMTAVGSTNDLPYAGAAPYVVGVVGALGLIVIQLLWRPKLFQINTVEAPVVPAAPPHASPGESPASRNVTLIGGKVNLSHGDWPLLGSPDAADVFVYFFDYTCDNCRQLHSMLTQVVAEDWSVAFLLIPVPGEPTCNPHVSRRDPKHVNACALARLGLVVWLDAPSGFAKYDEFVFAAEEPPPISAVVAFAQGLVADRIYDPAIPDPDVDPRLQSGIALFHSLELTKTPALVLTTGVLRGSVATVKELRAILEKDRAAR
jgi:uncharacterized membrane protein/protein-disulfide isomerase